MDIKTISSFVCLGAAILGFFEVIRVHRRVCALREENVQLRKRQQRLKDSLKESENNLVSLHGCAATLCAKLEAVKNDQHTRSNNRT